MKSQTTFRFTGFLLTFAYTAAVLFTLAGGIELVYSLCSLLENQVSISVTLANQQLAYSF